MIKCDPRAIARCPFKKQCYGYDVEYFVEGSECDEFNKQLLTQPPTNADRIREMSDEELAEFLTYINPTNCQECAFSHGWSCQPDRDDYSDFEKCEEGRKRWLQQPAEEG